MPRKIAHPQEEESTFHRIEGRIPREVNTEAKRALGRIRGVSRNISMAGKVKECRHLIRGVGVKEENMDTWLTHNPHHHHG